MEMANMASGIDFGTKSVSVEAGECADDKTSFTMTLTGQPQIHGDHIIGIDFSSSENKISWSYIDATGAEIPIVHGASFLFCVGVSGCKTSYTLKAKALVHATGAAQDDLIPDLLPYVASAIYAPGWAEGYGQIKCSISKSTIKCPTIRILTAKEVLCPSAETPCALGHVIAVIPITDSTHCFTDITGITINGHNCNGDSLGYTMVKYSSAFNIWAQTHTDASIAIPGPFWACGVDSSFELESANVDTGAGSRECQTSGSTDSSGPVGYSISGGSPGYISPYAAASVVSDGGHIACGSDSAGAEGHADNSNPPRSYYPNYPLTNVRGWKWDASTYGPSLPQAITPTHYTIDYLNAVLNTIHVINRSMTVESCTFNMSLTIVATKACGSATIYLVISSAAESGTGKSTRADAPVNTSSTFTDVIASLPGMGGGSLHIDCTLSGFYAESPAAVIGASLGGNIILDT